MPRQLIYTSSQRGLTPGQSGYCTVARSRDLREALIPRIEKLSYYSAHGATVCAHRILDFRGTKFHVLSRIVDAGLDFTKRRSFLAHHLIFEPNELFNTAPPSEIFLKWKGWLEHWQGDPQWLEDNRPLPSRVNRDSSIAKADLWISCDEADQKNFLPALSERGADWDITFTSCFQPGDHPDDFDLKAAWPNTPGYEAAERLDANFIRIDQLPVARRPAPIPSPEQPAPVLEPTKPIAVPPRPNRLAPFLPFAAVVLAILAFILALYARKPPAPPVTNASAPVETPSEKPNPDISADLNILLPNRPTWLVLDQTPAAIPPVKELLQELRANEVFTKDLNCTIQTNLLKPALPASLFAEPGHHLLRFKTTDSPPVEVTISSGSLLKSHIPNSYAVEIPGRFRIVAIKTPVDLPPRFLTIDTNVEFHPDFEERIHHIEIPSGAQLALRPLIQTNGAWIDPLASAARDFAIVPSTILDVPVVQTHAAQIIAHKESRLRAYEDEQTSLADAQKKLLTDAQTSEQLKAKDHLAALQLAIPAAAHELDVLRAKVAAIPKDPARIDRFALFLCLSNVNTEIFRFNEMP